MVAFRCSIRISRARWTYGAALAAAPSISFAHAPGLVAPWPFDPAGALLLAILAVIYARGSRRLSQRSAVPRSRRGHAISFWTGWVSLVLALGPPVELWTDRSFTAHMAQHEILMLMAAPLLVAAKPAGVLMWGLPGFASRAYARLARAQRVRVLASGLCAPVAAWLIHAIVLWAWHVPAAFEAALAHDGMHWAQHTSFFVAAVIFWWSVLVSGPLAERRGIATLSVFTTGVHTSILGALLTFSTQVWYPTYVRTGGIWGLTPLEDQQLGGLIMWVPGGTVFVIVGIVLVAMWLKEMEKRAAPARTS